MISNYVNDYEYATRKVNRVRACPWLLDWLGRWGFCCNPSGFGNLIENFKTILKMTVEQLENIIADIMEQIKYEQGITDAF